MSSLLSQAARTATRILDWVAPLECPRCADRTAPESPACARCLRLIVSVAACEHLREIPMITAARFEGPLTDAIRGLKYRGRHEWARGLGCWTAARVRPHLPHLPRDCRLVPVPLHRRRLAERGYNQAALIAASLGVGLGVRTYPLLLRRCRDTPQQVLLDRKSRLANVRHGFQARANLAGNAVVLVDDVVTTGATAEACVSALQAAGAAVLAIVAVARASYAASEAGDDAHPALFGDSGCDRNLAQNH